MEHTRVGYRLVLRATCVGHRLHVFLFAVVVEVVNAGAQTQGAKGGDIALHVLALSRRFQIGNVLRDRRLADAPDWRRARTRLAWGDLPHPTGSRESGPDWSARA